MDAKLVNEIVEQVLKALGQAPHSASAPTQKPTDSRPSASSDAQKTNPKSAPNASAIGLPSFVPVKKYVAPAVKEWSGTWGVRSTPKSAPKPPAKLFVTAEMLQQRLAGAGGSIVELACNEFLTPNAEDYADRKHITIKRAAAKSPGGACAAPVAGEHAGASQTARRFGMAPRKTARHERLDACLRQVNLGMSPSLTAARAAGRRRAPGEGRGTGRVRGRHGACPGGRHKGC